MNITSLLIGALVVLLLLVVLLVVLGNKRKKDKTVSFTKEEQPKELTREEKSGNYTAAGGFNFAPAKEPELLDGQELKPAEPAAPEPVETVAPVAPEPVEEIEVSAEPVADTPIAQEVAEELAAEPVEPAPEPAQEPVAPSEPSEPEVIAEAEEAAEAAAVTADAAEAALEQTPVPESEPEPAPEPVEEIEPVAGRLGKLRGKLAKSNNFLGQSVLGMLTAGDLDEDAWEEIEDQLIMADLGTATTMTVVESLREKIAERGVNSEDEARAMLRETLIEVGKPELDRSIKAMPYEGKPAVVLVVGVNGTGKTTTTGKLARVLVSMGHKVLLGAADTFRAAAADQLETWGRRVGAQTVRGAEGADPASVAFDAVAKGVETQADVVLIDTAGRLHTSVGLMDQLGKVKRVVEKKAKVDEVLLVLDATVGQNGLMQARTFRDVVDITGVVLTKLDGTAKGGIVFQVQEELGVPVKLVGLGEGADHLAPFEVESFVDALLA
ncbi:signal recognition particle-docking protein FtsY [Corynebacterium hindlerae]|uniref:signal recognition particle-docking protein FtsY n=1 Tax=Corynebacterium hindlerae TaxID=699041 RepID=UPI003AAFB21B